MLHHPLYDITQQGPSAFVLNFHAEHPIYAAHFPSNPITPGVCFIQIAQDILSIQLQRECTIVGIPNFKLLHVHTPSLSLIVHILYITPTTARLQFESDNQVYSSITLEYI